MSYILLFYAVREKMLGMEVFCVNFIHWSHAYSQHTNLSEPVTKQFRVKTQDLCL